MLSHGCHYQNRIGKKVIDVRLIDADALSEVMYHEAFEKDTPMQRWDSGCWIRYKMFENAIENAPTVEPERKKGEWEQVEVNYLDDMDADIKESTAIASMYCPICKRYHNEVYLYGVPTYGVNYCPNCGAEMKGE